ncbi:hypothetical protein FOMPIDRAFT_1129443 [Fomitopsis schrenkii]|uniref:Essential protein Yae1 N-terminal domain-containing protein n=1 Tax=Fomitopsis schrenkii TaxID=2126942 RepID=S8F5L9_FOMSC|nr:hypothetical protein FOMPIDRAFT_1129443 [Fomitopsis schrenkii]
MDFDLEELINVEQTFYDEGYKDGFAHGRIHGSIEGKALGREKGFEMWEELGFYEGFAMLWQAVLSQRGKTDDRAALHLRQLLALLAQFPRVNPSATEPSELDIPKLFRQIRSRYKALCAVLGVQPTLRAGVSSATDDGDPVGDSAAAPPGGSKSVWPVQPAGHARAGAGEQQLSF